MKIKLEFRSKIPIYIQIIDQVKHLIASGVLVPDDQLPTVRELADDLGVNFTTVARAYRLLDEEGLISTQHGRGTYILPLPPDQPKGAFQLEDLEVEIESALLRSGYALDQIDVRHQPGLAMGYQPASIHQ